MGPKIFFYFGLSPDRKGYSGQEMIRNNRTGGQQINTARLKLSAEDPKEFLLPSITARSNLALLGGFHIKKIIR